MSGCIAPVLRQCVGVQRTMKSAGQGTSRDRRVPLVSEVSPDISSTDRPTNLLGVSAVTAGATLVAYLGWLGWDQRKTRIPGTSDLEGPYEAWQVIGLGVTLVGLAAAVTWIGRGWVSVVIIPVVLTVAWSVDAATDNAPDANLWPIGAAFLAVGSFIGILVVCGLTQLVRRLARR